MPRYICVFLIASSATSIAWASGDEKLVPIDLQPYANRKLAENLGTGASGNDLNALPAGEHDFEGVRFRIAEGLIQLGSKALEAMPEKVEGIKVDRKLSALHLLQATCFGGGPNQPGSDWFINDGTLLGEYRVNFDDHSAVTIPIVYGEDVRDWFYVDGEKEPSRAKVVWKGENDRASTVGSKIRLYASSWKNPWPEKNVVSIDYLSRKDETFGAPFCIAISAEITAAKSAAANVKAHEALDAALWIATAPEYEACCRETFNTAEEKLEAALRDKTWTAWPEQFRRGQYDALPSVVVVNLDETVWSTAGYHAELIAKDAPFEPTTFAQWCKQSKCQPLPGAKHFLDRVNERDAAIVYISRRPEELREATLANLRKADLPYDSEKDSLLLSANWSQAARREQLIGKYRILLVVSDSLADFLPSTTTNAAAESERAKRIADYVGLKWFLLPNPLHVP